MDYNIKNKVTKKTLLHLTNDFQLLEITCFKNKFLKIWKKISVMHYLRGSCSLLDLQSWQVWSHDAAATC